MITVGLYGIPDTTCGDRPTYVHDHGVAVMRDGQVLSVVQLERWTGVKHDNRLGDHIHDILNALVPHDEPVRFVSVNAFVGSSFISTDGNLRIEPERLPGISFEPTPAKVTWYPDGLKPRPAEGFVVSHEAAHVASLLPFVGRFEEGALAAHIDGGAYQSACSFWRIQDGRPQLEEASWDLLKDVVNNFNVNPAVRVILGLEPRDHLAIPGRLMGFAALGRPSGDLGAWLVEQRFLLGMDDEEARRRLQRRLGEVGLRSQACQDLCATIQEAFEQAVRGELEKRGPQGSALYLSGGAGLNIPTNTALLNHFGDVWVPPPTNDSGLALGGAALVEYLDHGELSVHGPFLNAFGGPCDEPETGSVPEVAAALAAGEVIGVCNGAAEVGPRALGHRSLLARADSVSLRERVSEQIKRREWYRPVAPILCREAAEQVLEERALSSCLTRWMLGAWQVHPQWRDQLRGVLHADGSVRAQVVVPDGTNTWMHALLLHLWREHDLPALINTSFNGPGQPIVQRHADALVMARELQLDGVVVHGSLHRP